jgi:hypothetical protein
MKITNQQENSWAKHNVSKYQLAASVTVIRSVRLPNTH